MVLTALRDTSDGQSRRLKALSDATHASLLVTGTIVLRGDSLVLQGQVTDVRTDKIAFSLEPAAGLTGDPIAAVDALGDRLLGAIGGREMTILSRQGWRAPTYAANQEFNAGFERFAVFGDVIGSRPFFERAIALDSTYTRAYLLLGRQYINAGEFDRADSMARRIERLPQGLSASERLQLEYMKADLSGDIAGLLRSMQQLVARDSNSVSVGLVGEAGLWMMRPDIAVPAYESSDPGMALMGGRAARGNADGLAEAYHEAGMHDRELRLIIAKRALFPDPGYIRGRILRADAGLARPADAVALADTMARAGADSSGRVLSYLVTGAAEFRAHGDSTTASRLLAVARAWIAAHPVGARSAERRLLEGVALLASGMPDSAAGRLASGVHDTTGFDAAGYLALARAAMGDGTRARAAADSLGNLRRRWLYGENTFWRAAIMGSLGERDLAVQLLQQANREGQPMQAWHYHVALVSLHGYPPFEALVRPRRQ
jgi:tetratricopeptide (TPR) repeat protein